MFSGIFPISLTLFISSVPVLDIVNSYFTNSPSLTSFASSVPTYAFKVVLATGPAPVDNLILSSLIFSDTDVTESL